MNRTTLRRPGRALLARLSIIAAATSQIGCATRVATADHDPSLEQIHLLRSIREPQAPVGDWCARSRTGFDPVPTNAERLYSFWSIRSRPEDGRVVDAKDTRVAELHACFGATPERTRQAFYAEGRVGDVPFRGRGECVAVMSDFPQPGLFPVACRLVLSHLPAPFVGGLLTTNTIVSNAAFGGATEPPGYTQASIATVRLWRARTHP